MNYYVQYKYLVLPDQEYIYKIIYYVYYIKIYIIYYKYIYIIIYLYENENEKKNNDFIEFKFSAKANVNSDGSL